MADTPTVVTITPEIRAALDALDAIPSDQQKDALAALHNHSGPIVKAFRGRAFAGGKEEGKKANANSETLIAEKDELIDDLKTQLEAATSKTQDAKAIEERLTKAWQKKVDAEKQRADKAEQTLTGERQSGFKAKLAAQLRDLNVRPEYVDTILTAKYADRIRVNADGSRQVLKPGEDTAYEVAGDDAEDAAVKLLAADVRKAVEPFWIVSNGDSGASITNNTGGGGFAQAKSVPQRAQEIAASPTYPGF